jgi:ribosomal protein L14
MIKKMTLLGVADNCGISKVKTIHHYHGFNKQTSRPGQFIKISVRKRKYNYKWVKSKKVFVSKKGKRHKAYFIRARYRFMRPDGSYSKFASNCTVLLKKRLTTRGKFVRGPFIYGLRRKKIIQSFPGTV